MSSGILDRVSGLFSQSPHTTSRVGELHETASPSRPQSKKRAASETPLPPRPVKHGRKALPLARSPRTGLDDEPANGARSSQRTRSPAKSQPPQFATQPSLESQSIFESQAPLTTILSTDHDDELDSASQIPYSGTPEQSQYVQVVDKAVTATQHEDAAEEISVEVNTKRQLDPMDEVESSLLVDSAVGSNSRTDGEDGPAANSPPEVDVEVEAPHSPKDDGSAATEQSATLDRLEPPSRNPEDIYEVPSDKEDKRLYVFTDFLDYRWRGTTVELLVAWHGTEPTWEPEANLHRDALDALLNYWQKKGGHPENPKHEGLYDIYCIREHSGQRLLVEWTGYPPSEATWEPKSKIKKVAPQIVAEYFANLESPAPKRRGRKKKRT